MRKSIVIPNGIDDFFIGNAQEKKCKLHDPLRIIHVGDINTNKNISTTIQAIERLIKRGIKPKYILIGEVKDEEIGNLIKQKSYVFYMGKQPKEIVLEMLRESDIFVMPSHHETFGLVYGEAMSQGLPVIYTRGQGFDGQFNDGVVGYAVDDNCPDEIVRAIEKIISSYQSLSENCLKYINKFDWSFISMEYKEVYKESLCYEH